MFSGIDAFGHRAGVAYRGNNLNQHVDVTDRWATTAVYGGTTYDLAPGCCKADGTCFRWNPSSADCVAGNRGISSGPNAFVPTDFTQADAACGMPRGNQSLVGILALRRRRNFCAGVTTRPRTRLVRGRGQSADAASLRTRPVRGSSRIPRRRYFGSAQARRKTQTRPSAGPSRRSPEAPSVTRRTAGARAAVTTRCLSGRIFRCLLYTSPSPRD